MDKGAYRQGQYAEVMTEYAEHIYRDSICKTERNYKFIAPEGTEREVDVCTTLKSGEKIAFEVRDRKSTQSIDWVDQIIGKYLTSPFEQVWLCTFDGCSLSSEAIKKLQYHGIGWRDFTLVSNTVLDQKPILMISGIKLDVANASLTIDGADYNDLEFSFVENEPPVSYIKMCEGIIKEEIKKCFSKYELINSAIWEEQIQLSGIDNNFNKDSVIAKLVFPLKHITYVDYFDEEYIVKNNTETDDLLSTQNKSIFISGDTLAIDFGYFNSLDEDAVLESNFLIDLRAIPDKYRMIRHVRFMDVEGKGKIIPMKMYGIK